MSAAACRVFIRSAPRNNKQSFLPSSATKDARLHYENPGILHYPRRTSITTTTTSKRWLGSTSGTRGARGHGWYLNYRAGKGGRHLQGEYHDRESLEECQSWNDAILQLGSTRTWLDVTMEPRNNSRTDLRRNRKNVDVPPLDELTGETYRLKIDVASTVMPETTDNFKQLLLLRNDGDDDKQQQGSGGGGGYKGTSLYRVEKRVGLCGGDTLTNTGKTGRAAQGNPMTIPIPNDPLCLWHIPGTVTMLVPTVGQIDSRFMLCSEMAPHIDGICRAFGRLTPKSLAVVDKWQSTLMTRNGIPTAFDLIVTDCGVVAVEKEGVGDDATSKTSNKKAEANAKKVVAKQQSA